MASKRVANMYEEPFYKQAFDAPLLSEQEEIDLFVRIKAGDRHAEEQVMQAHFRLVVNIASSFVTPTIELDDLVQAGNLALLQAVRAFDAEFGARFSAFAKVAIRREIISSLPSLQTGSSVLVTKYGLSILRAWDDAAAALQERGHRPSDEEVAATSGIPECTMKSCLRARQALRRGALAEDISEGVPIGKLGNSSTTDSHTPLIVQEYLKMLDPEEQKFLELRFGLNGNGEHTLREIGTHLGHNLSRVCAIQIHALKNLKDLMTGAPKKNTVTQSSNESLADRLAEQHRARILELFRQIHISFAQIANELIPEVSRTKSTASATRIVALAIRKLIAEDEYKEILRQRRKASGKKGFGINKESLYAALAANGNVPWSEEERHCLVQLVNMQEFQHPLGTPKSGKPDCNAIARALNERFHSGDIRTARSVSCKASVLKQLSEKLRQ